MKLYAISTEYLPLVTVNLVNPGLMEKPIRKKAVSVHDIKSVFNASQHKPLIVLDNKEDAQAVVTSLLEGHNITADFIEQGVRLFASLVIFELAIDDSAIGVAEELKADDLVRYANKKTIPLFDACITEEYTSSRYMMQLTEYSQKVGHTVYGRKLLGLTLDDVTGASFYNAAADALTEVNLVTPNTGFFASLKGLFSSCSNDDAPASKLTAPGDKYLLAL